MAEYIPPGSAEIDGRVVSLRRVFESGLRKTGAGQCFGRFEVSNPACMGCLDADDCESYVLDMNTGIVDIAVRAKEIREAEKNKAIERVPRTKQLLAITEDFMPLHQGILGLTPKIASFCYKNHIKYKYARYGFLIVVGPISTSLKLVFKEFMQDDFKDPNQAMFVGLPSYPKWPAMFVRKDEQPYALGIVRQALKRLELKLHVLSKEALSGKRRIPKTGE